MYIVKGLIQSGPFLLPKTSEDRMHILTVKMIFSLVFSFLITAYLVPVLIAIAHKWQFMDVPDGKIKQHAQATPFLGGIAVYCGFLAGLMFTVPFENYIVLLLVGSTLLLFIGLVDDFVALAPYQKFFGQFLVGLCFLKAGFYLKEQFFYNTINIPISLLWILTVINAFNLVDVMDGLATTLAISATISFLVLALYAHHVALIITLCAFLGALCGFLWYNKPPAHMYLGDAGALFIGGFLATIPFLLNWGTYTPYGYLAPVIILAIPLIECTSLIIIRWHKKIPFYRGSPDHFCHYLMRSGWSKATILVYVVLLSIFLGVVAFFLSQGVLNLPQTIILGVVFMVIWIANLLFYPQNHPR